MNIINIDEHPRIAINEAKKIFFEGKIFVYPTDTIYGLGGNPFNNLVVERINKIKNRDESKKFILLVGDLEILKKYAEIKNESHFDFLLKIWPNPISIILKLNQTTTELLNSSDAAFRIPNNNFCLKLLKEIKMPLISTSVNRAKEPPINDYAMITQEFNDEIDTLFYTNKKLYSASSTIIDLKDSYPKLIREGKIKFTQVIKMFDELK